MTRKTAMISLRLIWSWIVKSARRFSLASLSLIWKIRDRLTRHTADRGSAPEAGHSATQNLNTSVEETIPATEIIHETTPIAFGNRRYDKSISDFSTMNMLIAAGHPSQLDLAPVGWRQLSNPEGQPYFYHPQYQIVTENNIIDPDIRVIVEDKYKLLDRRAQGLKPMNPASTEFLIDVQVEDGPQYYGVDHKEHTVFWLTNKASQDLDLEPAYSESHMALQRQSWYWSHVEFFSMHVTYPEDSENYLFSVLNQSLLDGITCPTSTALYSPEECERFIKILNNFRNKDGYRLWSLARIWTAILKNRFIHLHGQQPARLHRLARLVPDTPPSLSLVPRFILGSLLFNAYQGHINALEDIYVDGITYTQHWRSFLEERVREWNAVTIVSTVLWTAGVGLLQVMVNEFSGTYTLIRDLVIASTFCSMTSTVLSLLHDRQHRRRAKEDDSAAATTYLYRHHDPKRGFLPLAMLYCLPYVLLLWAFLLAAVATFVFGITSGGGIVVGAVAAILGAAVIITILTWNIEGSVSQHMRTAADAIFGQWKTKYLLLFRDVATRRPASSDSNSLSRDGIVAAVEAPTGAEAQGLPPS